MASLYGHAEVLETNRITSDVYLDRVRNGTTVCAVGEILGGTATDFAPIYVQAVMLGKGPTLQSGSSEKVEEIIIVKEGRLRITINGESKTVGPGSVAMVMPGDTRSFSNAADGETTYYQMGYRSKKPADVERGKKAGGSFVMDWNDVKEVPRDDGAGSTRQFFSRATAMGRRMDLHATLLNPGQNTHAPHHHRAEEMVIMLEGDVEEYLGPEEKGGKSKKATAGDIIYMVSNEYHAIRNIGTKPALYFAFQFE